MELFSRTKTLYLGHTSDAEAKEMIKKNIVPLVIYNPNMDDMTCSDEYICLNRGTEKVKLAKNVAVFEPSKHSKVKYINKDNEVIKVMASYYENGDAAYLLKNNVDFNLKDVVDEEIEKIAKLEQEQNLEIGKTVVKSTK